ncbi:MAG: TonB-dependent receptor, partial [Bryobacteraceae bacterium]|nr:TonB-dependent receptor [Bryobacteraceae bacterium]
MKKLLAAAFFLLTTTLTAQDYRAKVSGEGLDASGVTVPKVKVELTSKASQLTVTTVSNESGVYLFQFLDSGEYRLSAASPGFKTFVQDGLRLETGQSTGVDIILQVGDTAERIEVQAEIAALDTESASRGLVVNQLSLRELPVRSQNPLNVVNLLPGTTQRGAGVFMSPFSNSANVNIVISGGSPSQNEMLIDGAPNTARTTSVQNNIALMPVQESVGEVTVITNAYDASYGRTSGGVVNFTTLGGTSQHHLTGWSYFRRKQWNANAYPLNAIGSPRAEQSINQWGFQAAGPIEIPKLLRKNGKYAFFYLGSYENYKELFPQPIRVGVPTAQMRAGDFSQLRNATGDLITIYDPFNPSMDAAGNPVRRPFPGNVIPASRIDPVAAAVTKYFQEPNDPGLPNQRFAAGNFSLPQFSYDFNFWNWNSRIDAKLGDNDRLFFRFSTNKHTQERTLNGILGRPGEQAYNPFLRRNHAYMLDWVRVLSPSATLNVRANYARYVEGNDVVGNLNFNQTTLGLPASLSRQLAFPEFFGVWALTGYSQLGFNPNLEYNNTYSSQANLTKVWGSHTLKAGMDLRRIHFMANSPGNPFRILSNAGFTREVWNNAASEVNSGDAFASFLLGTASGGSADYVVRPFLRGWYFAPYVQDDWKVTRKLTVNLGLRWDYNPTYDEKHDRLVSGFDQDVKSPIADKIPAAMLALYPQLRDLRGGLQFAGVNGNPRTATNTTFSTLQPRVGVAWRVGENMVLRGGYGLFYANWPTTEYSQTQGFSTSTSLVSSTDGGRTPTPNTLTNPFPGGVQTPIGSSLGLNTFAGQNFSWWNRDAKLPRVHQFSFGIQRRLTAASSIDLSYVGSRTQNLMTSLQANLQPDSFISQCDPSRGGNRAYCDALVPNPFFNLPEFAGTSLGLSSSISRQRATRPFPQFDGDLTELGRSDGRMWYNSGQAVYRHVFRHGLMVNANYTFSKQISEEGWLNTYAQVPQRSLTTFDRTHVVKFSTHYELPFGRGRKFASGVNSWVDRLIGGWDLNAFYTATSGEPADLPGNAIMLKDPGIAADRSKTIVRGWNPCVLQTNANGSVTPTRASTVVNGCSATDFSDYAWLIPRNELLTYRTNPLRSGQIRMPAQYLADLSLNKTFKFGERMRAQFRAEAFNAFNRFNVFSVRYNTNPLDANGNF